jgi:hypothetical protein
MIINNLCLVLVNNNDDEDGKRPSSLTLEPQIGLLYQPLMMWIMKMLVNYD